MYLIMNIIIPYSSSDNTVDCPSINTHYCFDHSRDIEYMIILT